MGKPRIRDPISFIRIDYKPVITMVCVQLRDCSEICIRFIVVVILNTGSSVYSSRTSHEERLLQDYSYHEETVPSLFHGRHQITSTKAPEGHLGAITLTFKAHNKTFVADLQLNVGLFSERYIEKFYVDGRAVINNQSNHKDSHCYYHGRLREDHNALVAVSTCQGISGSIFSPSGSFHITPTEAVIAGRHLVFNGDHQHKKDLQCGHCSSIFPDPLIRNKNKHYRLKRASVKDWPYDTTEDTRIVEMYIVNDKTEYDEYGKDVIDRTKNIINVVSSLYRPISLYVALVGVEVWTEKDLIDIVEDPDTTMNNFLAYRREHITVETPNDNAQLITGRTLGSGVVGKAPIMTICSWQYSGGVNMDHNRLQGPVATTLAHELGHNFGLSHDTDTCGCPDERCIMAASSGGLNNPTKWSQCSKRQFADAFEQGMDYCLTNLPTYTFTQSCGNGIMEDGEECDCGLHQDCNTACCDAITCRLTENATCATGRCCDLDTCKLKPAATVCRAAQGSCDLPETCFGNSEHCPDDTYLVDGSACDSNGVSSFCYHGKCRSHESQCQLLWGHTGHNSHPECYRHYNTMGQANGHCGFQWVNKSFLKCAPEDVLCGMLHCTHLNEKLMFWKEALTYTMPEGSVFYNNLRHECKSAILDVGLNMPDPGMVPDGAVCGTNKICVSQKCTSVAALDVMPCPDCNGRGVCNNYGQCHCDARYAPPTCKNPGHGGSSRSGPITVSNEKVPLIVGLCVFFFIIVPLLVLAAVYGYRHRDNLKQILLHGPTEEYRSVSRHKPQNTQVNRLSKHVPVSSPTSISSPNHCDRYIPEPTTVTTAEETRPPRRQEMKRAASFRPQDIGRPQLESSTKPLNHIPALRHSIGATLCNSDGGLPHDFDANESNHTFANHSDHNAPESALSNHTHHRPAPPPPDSGNKRWSSKVNNPSHLDAPLSAKPGRPPPPRDSHGVRRQSTNSPKANQPLPPEPSPHSWYSKPVKPKLHSYDEEPLDANSQPPPEYPASEYPAEYPPEYPQYPPRRANDGPRPLERDMQALSSGKPPPPKHGPKPSRIHSNRENRTNQSNGKIDLQSSSFRQAGSNSQRVKPPVRHKPTDKWRPQRKGDSSDC